ncbi:MAG: flagellar filament capping protein FliD, partial [Acidobacteria bacterium]|nr:flagellar filament capping protein FliD [Acidobacteriota bacterium]
FSNGLSGSITADLESFFVGSQAPSGISAGDTISVTFISTDLTIDEGITTVALDGTETTADIAQLLNDQITANGNLSGKVSFSDEGGKLKLVVSDTAGQGFTFTSSNTGTVVSGLEAGGTVGGHSAAEIAAALNAQVALDPTLVAAAVTFSAVNGEVKVLGNTAFDITVTDSAQGTGFVSGLAGTQSVAGYDNTLAGLRDFINDASLGLTASLINTSSDPDVLEYHLSLTAKDTGVTTLTLKDSGAADLLTLSDQGTDAIFTVNGLSVTNSENTITDFEPGLSVTITGAGSATVTVATDRTALSSAIAAIVANYNSVVAAIQSQIGENAGVLSGSLIVRQAQQTLREITSFTGSGTILSIVELGLELDDKGLMSFNSTTFDALSDTQLGDVLTFVGDTTSGFAGGAVTRLNDLADPVTGQIETAIGFLVESDESITVRIDAARERVDKLITTLEQQFAAADLLLAQLESQENLLTTVFQALEDVRGTFR